MFRNFKYLILVLLLSCKSVKDAKDNKIDTVRVDTDKTEKVVQLDRVEFLDAEIIIIPEDPKEEIIVKDSKGITKTFKNVKSVTIKKKKVLKDRSKIDVKKDITNKLTDKSKIKETTKTTSDTAQYKWMLISISSIVFFALVGYLVFKSKS